MFDVNPNPDGGESALDRGDPMKDAAYYRLSSTEANRIYKRIKRALE